MNYTLDKEALVLALYTHQGVAYTATKAIKIGEKPSYVLTLQPADTAATNKILSTCGVPPAKKRLTPKSSNTCCSYSYVDKGS